MASIVVVGGGIAGLACAWRLQRAGHDVEVLERESIAGGRMRSESCDGFTLERGAQFLSSRYRNLHDIAHALGLADSIHDLRNTTNAVLRNGRFVRADWNKTRDLLRSSLLSPVSRARLARLGFDLVRHRKILNTSRPELAGVLDREDAATYLARTVGAEARDYLVGPAIQATFDCDIGDVSAAFLLLALRFGTEDFALQTLDGGLGRFTQTLASELAVRTGCEVLSVHTETEGARVAYRSGERQRSVVADAAVVALPGPLVPAVCAKLTPTERGFFESVRFVRGIIVHLMLEEPPPGLPYYGVAFPRPEGLDLYGMAADHYKDGAAPDGAGLINAALTAEAAGRVWDAPDDAVATLVRENLARTPLGELSPIASAVHRWPLMLPVFGTGSLLRLGSFLSRADRSPRLAFAGDYLVGPYTEAALLSGMRAASEVADALRNG